MVVFSEYTVLHLAARVEIERVRLDIIQYRQQTDDCCRGLTDSRNLKSSWKSHTSSEPRRLFGTTITTIFRRVFYTADN